MNLLLIMMTWLSIHIQDMVCAVIRVPILRIVMIVIVVSVVIMTTIIACIASMMMKF